MNIETEIYQNPYGVGYIGSCGTVRAQASTKRETKDVLERAVRERLEQDRSGPRRWRSGERLVEVYFDPACDAVVVETVDPETGASRGTTVASWKTVAEAVRSTEKWFPPESKKG